MSFNPKHIQFGPKMTIFPARHNWPIFDENNVAFNIIWMWNNFSENKIRDFFEQAQQKKRFGPAPGPGVDKGMIRILTILSG